MILVDVNILLYASNDRAPEHDKARYWLAERLSSPELFAFSWQTLAAFLRLSTSREIFSAPLSISDATEIVTSWLDQPMVTILEPGARYWEIASSVVQKSNSRGALVMDALLAALAIEHGATLATHDLDFRRFDGLRTIDPIAD